MEKILKESIYLYLERKGLIRDSQHGFIRRRLCLTNLIEFFEVVTRCVDEGSTVDVAYMDFSKAVTRSNVGDL